MAANAALSLAREIVSRFQLTDLQPLLAAIEKQLQRRELNLGVFGRFKAGKSSFINHLLRRDVLPVGVIPVTSAVTQIRGGEKDSAEVRRYAPDKSQSIPVEEIASYVTETRNPGNAKKVSLVQLELPEMQSLPGIQLVDTPGLESIFAHNTETTSAWFPNVDFALVAVSVDPPLTRQDVALIERLFRFTPKVCVLLTKVDQLDERGRADVMEYVTSQLHAKFGVLVTVFPYSIRPGYETLRENFEKKYLRPEIAAGGEIRGAVLNRKLEELLRSAEAYLALALRTARQNEAGREAVRNELREFEISLPDRKLQIRLAVQNGIGQSRGWIEKHVQGRVQKHIVNDLAKRFDEESREWRGTFAKILAAFEFWLGENLRQELADLSAKERAAFLEPLQLVRRQIRQQLQNVRDQFSGKLYQLTGASLATAEPDIEIAIPDSPDISIGRIFDRNWELISLLIPMPLVRGMVRKRFSEKIASETDKNISRLISQWEEALAGAMKAAEIESERRLHEYAATIGRMMNVDASQADEFLAAQLQQLQMARAKIATKEPAAIETPPSHRPSLTG